MLSTLALSKTSWLPTLAVPPSVPSLRTVEADDPDRSRVEAFIQDVFRRHHSANVRSFAPTLVAMHNRQGDLVAAAGYRCAAEGPLFLERYLDRPVEGLLSEAGGPAISRRRIVEVGHLAATEAGQGRRLILALGTHLALHRYPWVVATLTQELRHLFTRLGIEARPLARARPDVLGRDAADWGRYYEHGPMVFAGRLDVPSRV